jgi:hypothetical protein
MRPDLNATDLSHIEHAEGPIIVCLPLLNRCRLYQFVVGLEHACRIGVASCNVWARFL